MDCYDIVHIFTSYTKLAVRIQKKVVCTFYFQRHRTLRFFQKGILKLIKTDNRQEKRDKCKSTERYIRLSFHHMTYILVSDYTEFKQQKKPDEQKLVCFAHLLYESFPILQLLVTSEYLAATLFSFSAFLLLCAVRLSS